MKSDPSRSKQLRWRCLAASALAALCVHAGAADVPVDPWTDDALQPALLGLKPGGVRSVLWSVQLFSPQRASAAPIDTRSTLLAFDAAGQVETVTLARERQNERATSGMYRYRRDAAGRVARIDRDGSPEPLLARRYDSAGRLMQEDEKVGVLQRRTQWRYDAAGRELERSVAEGTSTRTTETRSYRRDGTLERLEMRGGESATRTVDFDTAERPTKIAERDRLSRQTTRIRYLDSLQVEYQTDGIAATRDRFGSTSRTVLLRVRHADDFKRPGEPLWPVSRRVTQGDATVETQTDYDEHNRPRVQRYYGKSGQLECTSDWQWHASGLPDWIHTTSARPGASCGLENGTVDMDITVDERGNWVRQVIEITYPTGRARISVQTREIEYR